MMPSKETKAWQTRIDSGFDAAYFLRTMLKRHSRLMPPDRRKLEKLLSDDDEFVVCLEVFSSKLPAANADLGVIFVNETHTLSLGVTRLPEVTEPPPHVINNLYETISHLVSEGNAPDSLVCLAGRLFPSRQELEKTIAEVRQHGRFPILVTLLAERADQFLGVTLVLPWSGVPPTKILQ